MRRGRIDRQTGLAGHSVSLSCERSSLVTWHGAPTLRAPYTFPFPRPLAVRSPVLACCAARAPSVRGRAALLCPYGARRAVPAHCAYPIVSEALPPHARSRSARIGAAAARNGTSEAVGARPREGGRVSDTDIFSGGGPRNRRISERPCEIARPQGLERPTNSCTNAPRAPLQERQRSCDLQGPRHGRPAQSDDRRSLPRRPAGGAVSGERAGLSRPTNLRRSSREIARTRATISALIMRGFSQILPGPTAGRQVARKPRPKQSKLKIHRCCVRRL